MAKIKKILYAIGNERLEERLTAELDPTHQVAATVVHRSAIIPKLNEIYIDDPNSEIIALIAEGLPTPDEGMILSICQQIRVNFAYVRIIFLGGEHEIGDKFLKALVQMGIYDVMFGKVNYTRIVELIYKPNTYSDALSLIEKSNITETESLGSIQEAQKEAQVFELQKTVVEPKKSIFGRNKHTQTAGTQEKVSKSTSSEPVKKSEPKTEPKPVLNQEVKADVQNPDENLLSQNFTENKVTVSTGTRTAFVFSVTDGFMAREVALSLSSLMAKSKKVLLVDISSGEALLPPRLNIKITGGLGCFADLSTNNLSSIPAAPYIYKNTAIPPSLSVLAYSEGEAELSLEQMDRAFDVVNEMNYEMVIYVCDRANDDVISLMQQKTMKQVLVTDQYSVSVNRSYRVIKNTKMTPALCVTGTVKSIKPRMRDLLSLYGLHYGEELDFSIAKLLNADANAVPYIKESKKLLRLVSFIYG